MNGFETLSARTSAKDGSGNTVDVSVVAIAYAPGVAYSFLVIEPQGQGLGDLAPLVNSFRRMSAAEAGAVKARVINVVTAKRGDTVATMGARMAYPTQQAERFRVLNGLPVGATTLIPGSKVKLVVLSR